jgi:hypothetical protein
MKSRCSRVIIVNVVSSQRAGIRSMGKMSSGRRRSVGLLNTGGFEVLWKHRRSVEAGKWF